MFLYWALLAMIPLSTGRHNLCDTGFLLSINSSFLEKQGNIYSGYMYDVLAEIDFNLDTSPSESIGSWTNFLVNTTDHADHHDISIDTWPMTSDGKEQGMVLLYPFLDMSLNLYGKKQVSSSQSPTGREFL
jgi:hypothetical protein